MKILVCGKGGSGKSVLTTLLAKSLARKGFKILVVDMDESNFGLHRQLGLELPKGLIDYLGGRKEAAKKLFSTKRGEVFKGKLRIEQIPNEYLAEKDGISLLAIGKIRSFGEGCACPMGALARTFLENLELAENEMVLVDSDAGVEHFGRGVEEACSLILAVVDPTYESVRLSSSILRMAESISKPAYLVLNKVNEDTVNLLEEAVDKSKILGVIPESREIFKACLKGEEINLNLKEVEDLTSKILSMLPGG